MPKKIYAFDFDKTLSINHTWNSQDDAYGVWDEHNYTEAQIVENKRKNFKHPELIRAIFNKIQKNGDFVAIASYHDGNAKDRAEKGNEVEHTSGPKYIRGYLDIALPGINQKDIMVRSYLPKDQNSGKNSYLDYLADEIGKKFELKEKFEKQNLTLIDDDSNNCALAKKGGYKSIFCKQGLSESGYLKELIKECGLTADELAAVKKEVADRIGAEMGVEIAKVLAKESSLKPEELSAITKRVLDRNAVELSLVDELIIYTRELEMKAKLEAAKAKFEAAKAELAGAEAKLEAAKAELEAAKAKLEIAKTELEALDPELTKDEKKEASETKVVSEAFETKSKAEEISKAEAITPALALAVSAAPALAVVAAPEAVAAPAVSLEIVPAPADPAATDPAAVEVVIKVAGCKI